MHLCLFEDEHVPKLRPLTETRAVYDLRLGMRTLVETVCDEIESNTLLLHTRSLVSAVTAQTHDEASINPVLPEADVLFVNGRFVASEGPVVSKIREYTEADAPPRAFTHDGTLVAAWMPNANTTLPADLLSADVLSAEPFSDLPTTPLPQATLVRRPWDLLDALRPALQRDAARYIPSTSSALTERSHASVHDSVVGVAPDQIVLGTGATIHPGAILNAESGPIIIDEEATIFEQAVVRGPCYVGPKTQIKGGANIEGASFGYYCKVGGEVHDTVIHSLSNKAHPGFLGHSYIGRWCNLGADSNTSNLRNDYGEISAYRPTEADVVPTGRQFAGLLMGDHSKCAINTMFNAGTLVGTFCNLYGSDFTPRYVPPFSWGGSETGFTTYRLQKALSVAERVMSRRDWTLTDADRTLLSSLFEATSSERAAHH